MPRAVLPEVRDCQTDYGLIEPEHFGAALPIMGVAGDQQAAAYGQACFTPGMIKATYGTGCFVLANTGEEKVASATRMLATIFYQLKGKRTDALEGAIFMAGATVQWLRDSLGLFASAAESEALAREADRAQALIRSAFQGLGAPFWDAGARGAVLGLSRVIQGRHRGRGAGGGRIPDPRSAQRHGARHGGQRHSCAVCSNSC